MIAQPTNGLAVGLMVPMQGAGVTKHAGGHGRRNRLHKFDRSRVQAHREALESIHKLLGSPDKAEFVDNGFSKLIETAAAALKALHGLAQDPTRPYIVDGKGRRAEHIDKGVELHDHATHVEEHGLDFTHHQSLARSLGAGPQHVVRWRMNILEDFSLTGKRAVVTGGGKGIGRGIALCLAEAGADVMVSARTNADVEAVAQEISALGRNGVAHTCDVTQPGALDRLAAAAVAELGGLDIWINNAGGLPDGTARYMTRTDPEQWQAQIDLNLTAVWKGCVAAAGHMAEGGSIINISSGAASGGQVKNGPYGASKAAVNSLTATFSLELAPKVRVNAVSPGPVPTQNFVESVGYEGERKEMIDKQMRIPLGRIGSERDIGGAVVFLASPAASWITGQILLVNGGR